MNFTDIHTHILYGVDDGPGGPEQMRRLLDALYADGVRCLCATSHIYPALFGDQRERVLERFAELKSHAAQAYPDLRLCLGSEVRCSGEIMSWLRSGACMTLNGGSHVLVDFGARENENRIVRGLEQILSSGYSPVLAHVERYERLSASAVRDLARNGVVLQADAGSFFGAFGPGAMYRARHMLRSQLLDVVASDAHDCKRRPPVMGRAYALAVKKCGKDYAEALFVTNPRLLLEENGWEERDSKR